MSKIVIDRSQGLIGTSISCSFEELVEGIKLLEDGINHPEDQSFYYNLAIDSHKQKLRGLKRRYRKIRDLVNKSEIGVLEEAMMEIKKIIEKKRKLPDDYIPMLVDIFEESPFYLPEYFCHISNVIFDIRQDDLAYLKEIIRVKNAYGNLPAIDEYLS